MVKKIKDLTVDDIRRIDGKHFNPNLVLTGEGCGNCPLRINNQCVAFFKDLSEEELNKEVEVE